MCRLMRRCVIMIVALLFSLVVNAQNEQLYGVYKGSGTLAGIGTQKAETYDVALHLTAPELAGLEIRGLDIPINTSATGLTEYKAWITKELTLSGGKNVADVASVDFTPNGKWTSVRFAEPYVLTEEGIYVGYSFTVPSVDVNNSSDPAKTPLMCFPSTETDDMQVHTSRSYRKWTPLAETTLTAGRALAFVVRLGGDRVKQYAANFSAPDELDTYSLTGKQKTYKLTLNNHGVANITRIEYDVEIDGEVAANYSKAVSLKGTYYGQHTTHSVVVPAQEMAGSKTVSIRITKINNEDNEDLQPATTFDMAFLAEMPKHKPLMEEYTGGWCGNCPRGTAAMEALTKKYGDDFVGVAYHNGDPMQLAMATPDNPSGYPHAYVDRVIDTDPFFGTSGGSLGIESDWKTRQAILTPATIELQADWTDEAQTAIKVTSTTRFIRNLANSPYSLSYILVADDLHNQSSRWNQSNYYSGTNESDPYLKPWADMPATIRDLHFKDVAIQLSSAGKTTIAGSLPAQVQALQPYEHTYTFDISSNSLVQDKTKLRVVAVISNTLTGEVANAEKAPVPSTPLTGIISATEAAPVARIIYTDLSGRRLTNASSGVCLQTIVRTDGTRETQKVIRK